MPLPLRKLAAQPRARLLVTRHRRSSKIFGQSTASSSPSLNPVGMGIDPEMVLEKLRAALKKRGAEGMQGLARNFRICDTNDSGQLDDEELAKCFRLCKISLTQQEFGTIFAFFDRSGDGMISYDEFIKTVRGKMNESRTKLCVKAYKALDAAGNGDGSLTVEDIAPFYDAKSHPSVEAAEGEEEKAAAEAKVLKQFLDNFEGRGGDGDGTVTIDEWISYYENISADIDDDDMFGTMVANSWAKLPPTKGPSGEDVPAVQYVSESDMSMLEKILVKNIYGKSVGVSEEKTLKAAFKQFDTDGSGEVSFPEFALAMERFGLSVQKPGARGKGGIPPEVLRGLFDRYNKDMGEGLSYLEFSNGLFKKEEADEDENAGPNEQGGQNPWLPSLAGRVSMDKGYSRPNTAQRMRSIANPAKNKFTLD